MSEPQKITQTVVLEYTRGADEPAKGIFRRFPVSPRFADELVLGIAGEDDPARVRWDAAQGPPQVHLAGTPRAFEELGTFLIALARLQTQDPAPSTSLSDVRFDQGGHARLIVHRLSKP